MATGSQKLTAVILFIAFICAIVALAVPQWTKSSDGNSYYGLWATCGSLGGTTICNDITDDILTSYCASQYSDDATGCENSFKAVRAFAVLAFIFSFFALVACMAAFFAGKAPAIAPAALAVIAGACAMLSFAIWVGKFKLNSGFEYGAGVAFAIITWLLEWAGAGLAFKSGGGGGSGGGAPASG
jgi:hypothetical protein